MINGAKFQVTESLVVMLHHIQDDAKVWTLWIDQLCINQSDSAEKSAQVPLMKEVYSKAKQTIVWLGPAADGSDLAMKFLADVGSEAWEFGLMKITLAELQNWSKQTEQNECLRSIKDLIDNLLERKGFGIPIEALGKLITRR
jgi:hypothetical protein